MVKPTELHAEPEKLLKVYQALYECYGPQNWWPAETAFEVMVGAILTQNTNWNNVEKAIHQLKKNAALSPEKILHLEHDELALMIKSSGYFNLKAQRLKNYSQWYLQRAGFDILQLTDTAELRLDLLGVNGIGPETADDILLYAFQRPVFVIDVYTRRLFSHMEFISGKESYEVLRQWFESSLPADTELFNQYHALIVRHAKERCQASSHYSHWTIDKMRKNSII